MVSRRADDVVLLLWEKSELREGENVTQNTQNVKSRAGMRQNIRFLRPGGAVQGGDMVVSSDGAVPSRNAGNKREGGGRRRVALKSEEPGPPPWHLAALG